MFNRYMQQISNNPKIIEKMQKNMESNTNDKAMEKLYEIVIKQLKDK